jgi:hypothetical protein
MDIMSRELPNFKDLNSVDGKIFGRHNKVESVNPFRCRFVAVYPGGEEIKGIDLFTTGWDNIPNGLSQLRYELSTGHKIIIPKYKAYLPQVEVSFGMDGSRVFHFINVNCLAEREIVIYKIVLRQDQIAPQKIGDVIMSKQPLPKEFHSSWKYTS